MLVVGFDVDDAALTELHARAFGNEPGETSPWAGRLRRYSVSWVGAFDTSATTLDPGDSSDRSDPVDSADGPLIGFVHACWDGGAHAFLLDAVVAPEHQGRGIGQALVRRLTAEVRAAGCSWLHVDFEPQLERFYRSCGFRSTAAGLIGLEPLSR